MIHTGHDNVDAAIPVKVAERTAAMACGGGIDEARFGSERLPFSAGAETPKNRVRLSDVGSRRVGRGDMATGDKQILPAIVVEIVERGAEARHAHTLRAHAAS